MEKHCVLEYIMNLSLFLKQASSVSVYPNKAPLGK